MATTATKISSLWRPLIIATIVAIVACPAEARMYQWTNAPSGTVQLSGTPPAWYRNGGSGPRIFVFDNGVLVDDTELLVSEEHRQRHAATRSVR